MEAILPIIIQVISGLAGGNGVGAALRGLSLGGRGNSVVGAIGGLVGGQVLSGPIGSMLTGGGEAAASGATDGIVTQIASGGVGGGLMLAVIGILKKLISR